MCETKKVGKAALGPLFHLTALGVVVYAILATDECTVTTTVTQENGSTITIEEKVCQQCRLQPNYCLGFSVAGAIVGGLIYDGAKAAAGAAYRQDQKNIAAGIIVMY